MTVSSALRELSTRWEAADAAADTLRLTVCEDAPTVARATGRREKRPPPPVENLGEHALELRAILAAGTTRLGQFPRDPEDTDSVDLAYAAVAFVQERMLEADRCVAGIGSVELLLALARESEARGGEWRGWWASVALGFEELRAALRDASAALVHCWHEFSELPQVRLGTATVGHLYVTHDPDPRTRPTTPHPPRLRAALGDEPIGGH
jgi:hypothetical protein